MFNNILVPLDGSELAEEALNIASRLAKTAGAKIHVIRAIETEPQAVVYEAFGPPQIEIRNSAFKRGQEYLTDVAGAPGRRGDTIVPHLRFGDAAAKILDVAAEEAVDLIVMTTHGRSGLSRLAMGSVTERVLRHATCTVLTMRSAKAIDNFIVTLDGSPLAEASIAPTMELARLLKATVTLLRVDDSYARLDPLTLKSAEMLNNIEPGLGENYLVDKTHEPEMYLERLRCRIHSDEVLVHAFCVNGDAAETILEYATANKNVAIAMSTHGRTGLRRWLYGSVTEKVLRRFEGPMLVVRPEEDAT